MVTFPVFIKFCEEITTDRECHLIPFQVATQTKTM